MHKWPLYKFPILWQLRRTAAPSNDLWCDAYQLEKLKPEQIQMSYLCDDGSVVHRKDSLHTNTCRYKYRKRSAPSNDLWCDAYQLEKLAGTNTDVVPMRRRKRCTWGRQSTTNTYVGTITEYGGTIKWPLMRCLPTWEVEAGTNTDVIPIRRRKRCT